jgi:hypothetical protein
LGVDILEITADRKRINKEKKNKEIANKKAYTILQRETLDKLYALACRAVELKTLYSIRRHPLTKKLSQKSYLDFIRVVDRLMESF